MQSVLEDSLETEQKLLKMLKVLGYSLEAGQKLLEEAGYNISVYPCDSKEMEEYDCKKIVRQRIISGNKIEILYGAFKTDV